MITKAWVWNLGWSFLASYVPSDTLQVRTFFLMCFTIRVKLKLYLFSEKLVHHVLRYGVSGGTLKEKKTNLLPGPSSDDNGMRSSTRQLFFFSSVAFPRSLRVRASDTCCACAHVVPHRPSRHVRACSHHVTVLTVAILTQVA